MPIVGRQLRLNAQHAKFIFGFLAPLFASNVARNAEVTMTRLCSLISISLLMLVGFCSTAFAEVVLRPMDGEYTVTCGGLQSNLKCQVDIDLTGDKAGKTILVSPPGCSNCFPDNGSLYFSESIPDGTATKTVTIPKVGQPQGQPNAGPENVLDLIVKISYKVIPDSQLPPASLQNLEESELMIEALVFDPLASTGGPFFLESIFDRLAQGIGANTPLLFPGIFADTDGDGAIGPGDFLYSLVDLNVYLPFAPDVTLGGTYDIIDGTAAGIVGMRFSTTPFTFDEASGFSQGTPYTGLGVTRAIHQISAIPEPGTLALLGLGLAGLGFSRRKRSGR